MGERLPSQKSYLCSFFDCKAKFTKSWKLEKPFSCEICDKSFCTRYQLTRHELSHSGEKPHKCLAEGCTEAFVTNVSMKNHMARVHQHQEKHYRCNYKGCGKDFNKRNQLSAHMYEHNQLLPFHCKFSGCEKEFPTHGKLRHHEKMHQGYPCEEDGCPFQGKTWTEYQKHRRVHKVKLSCGECKKRFNNSWFLHQHSLHVHSGEKKMLSCPKVGCDKKFTHGFNLDSHILGDHEGKKPFICAHDGWEQLRHAGKESLWRHGVVHDPERKKVKVGDISQPFLFLLPLLCIFISYFTSACFQKLHPKKNQPWHLANRARLRAAAKQVETQLAEKLQNTSLKDTKS
uniref:General transcription factor IIIA, b n=1 Tax=Sphaeramia orbicularis TaxID=375764 RepID=A0A672ZMU9_9TELE